MRIATALRLLLLLFSSSFLFLCTFLLWTLTFTVCLHKGAKYITTLEPRVESLLFTQPYHPRFMHHSDQIIRNHPRTSSPQSLAGIMPEGEAAQSQNQSQGASRGASRGRRGRGRGGRGRGHHGGSAQDAQGRSAPQADSSDTAPSSTPASTSQQDSAPSSNPSRQARGGRSRRGLRQGERGGARHGAPRAPQPATTRRFGGHLTVGAEDTPSNAPSLSAEAPEFVPGQTVLPRV